MVCNIILVLVLAATLMLGLPLFCYYMSIILYDVFCIIWNVVAFFVNAIGRRGR